MSQVELAYERYGLTAEMKFLRKYKIGHKSNPSILYSTYLN
jgi:hypothetical protein